MLLWILVCRVSSVMLIPDVFPMAPIKLSVDIVNVQLIADNNINSPLNRRPLSTTGVTFANTYLKPFTTYLIDQDHNAKNVQSDVLI